MTYSWETVPLFINDKVSDNIPDLSGVLSFLSLIELINLFRLSSFYLILIGALVWEFNLIQSLLFNIGIFILVFFSLISYKISLTF